MMDVDEVFSIYADYLYRSTILCRSCLDAFAHDDKKESG